VQDGMKIVLVDGILFSQIPTSGEGISRHFHPNGTLAAEFPMKYGRKQGTVREWHDNGQLAGETHYVYGMTIGLARTWDRDGSLSVESDYVLENAVIGRVYDDLGKVHRAFLWNGKPISKTRWIKKVLAEGIPLPDLENRISPQASPHADGSEK
jgi:antitoxin component YwqK of YwqJK toxin-antitoxin module